jgi:hypothetical protein
MSPSTKLPPGPSKRTVTTAAATATATATDAATILLNSKEKTSSGLRELCNKGVAWRKQTENAVVLQAAKDLLQARADTGGNATYGDVKHILQTYQDLGHVFVTRGRLGYQVEKLTRTKKSTTNSTTMSPSSTTFPSFINVSQQHDDASTHSELTDCFGPNFTHNESLAAEAAAAELCTMIPIMPNPNAGALYAIRQRNRPIATISTEQSNSNQQTNSYAEQRSNEMNRAIRDIGY